MALASGKGAAQFSRTPLKNDRKAVDFNEELQLLSEAQVTPNVYNEVLKPKSQRQG